MNSHLRSLEVSLQFFVHPSASLVCVLASCEVTLCCISFLSCEDPDLPPSTHLIDTNFQGEITSIVEITILSPSSEVTEMGIFSRTAKVSSQGTPNSPALILHM
jgi:hypothetical protein